MKRHIEKLIAEYEEKIKICDELISNLEFNIKQHRRNSNEFGYNECRKELALKQVQRQAYVQAKVDIDSLLDHV